MEYDIIILCVLRNACNFIALCVAIAVVQSKRID